VVIEPMVVAPDPLLTWAQEMATGLVREDRRTRLSDELYADVVGEILLAKLERKDPVARATAWLRAERSWRHHLAPLLEAA
jgi:LPS sulfotransferase NodH